VSGRSKQTEPIGDPLTWVSLREAAEQAEVPVSKVRGLYRASRVRSRKPTEGAREDGSDQRLVMVVLEDVLAQVGSARRVDDTPDTPPSSDVDDTPDGPSSSDLDDTPDTPPSSDVDAPPDTPPSSDVDASSSTIAINRDLLFRLTARLEEIQRSHGELAAARERAAREEEERDALRETLGKLQRRIERLERLYATEDSTDPSAGHANSADDAPVPYPDVEVEWQMEEPQEPKERSRFSFLQRRDHQS
jgi:hypothetical protein